MSDTNDTSTIDEKKIESEGGSSEDDPNYENFLLSLLVIAIIAIHFFLGSFVLYGCKLAQSNVLPTDINCNPYTDKTPTIDPIKTNIFKTVFKEKELSMKLEVPYAANASFEILDLLRQAKNKPTSNFLANYIISIFETLVASNFSIFNYIFNSLNKLPEMFIVLFGPFILGFSILFANIFNLVYIFFYLWFYNMSWFFKRNTNAGTTGGPIWDDVTFSKSWIDYFCSVLLVIVFAILWLIGAPCGLVAFSSVFFSLSIMTLYVCKLNDKPGNLLTIFLNVLKFYKVSIVTLACVIIILSAFANLGLIPGLIGLGLLFAIWYGLIGIDLFNTTNPDHLSALVSDAQASRSICDPVMQTTKHDKEKSGYLYSLYSTFFGQKGGGGNIAKDLKKFNKKYK